MRRLNRVMALISIRVQIFIWNLLIAQCEKDYQLHKGFARERELHHISQDITQLERYVQDLQLQEFSILNPIFQE